MKYFLLFLITINILQTSDASNKKSEKFTLHRSSSSAFLEYEKFKTRPISDISYSTPLNESINRDLPEILPIVVPSPSQSPTDSESSSLSEIYEITWGSIIIEETFSLFSWIRNLFTGCFARYKED